MTIAIAWATWNLRLYIICLPLALIGFAILQSTKDQPDYFTEKHPVLAFIFFAPLLIIALELIAFTLYVLGSIFLVAGELT